MNEASYHVLLVEDQEPDARFTEEVLADVKGTRFRISRAKTLADALSRIDDGGIDVVLLDLTLPDSWGLETFDALHAHRHDLPVVVLSGNEEESLAVEAVRKGAQDYLLKDLRTSTLLYRSLIYAIERNRLKCSLEASEQRFRQLAENMRDVFWLHDIKNGELLFVSPSCDAVWARPPNDFYELGDRWRETIHPEDHARVVAALRSKVLAGPATQEYRILRPDGEVRWIRDRSVPVRDEQGEVYRVARLAEDITEQKTMERELLDATSREQHRISRELHDSVGQELAALSFLANSLFMKLSEKSLDEAQLAQEIKDITHTVLRQVREAIHGLMPVEVDENGLMVALERLTNSTQDRFGIPCTFQCKRPAPLENSEVATQLYLIAQESLTNAVKHGKPTRIVVSLEEINGELVLQTQDNGAGFRASEGKSEGVGLKSMRYRANEIGGTLDIASRENSGTVVTCTLRRGLRNGRKQ